MANNIFCLKGKVALITGASYGIGFAIAKGLAAAGATIVFNDINQDLVDRGLAAYEEKGIKAHGYVCDVTDEPAVQQLKRQPARQRKLSVRQRKNAAAWHWRPWQPWNCPIRKRCTANIPMNFPVVCCSGP